MADQRNVQVIQGIAKKTGRAWETRWAHIWTLRDGLVVKLDEFYDTAAIVAAF